MDALVRLAACEFLMVSASDRLNGPDSDAASRVMAAVGWRWDLALRELEAGLPPLEDPQPSILDHVRAGEWEAASEKAKDALGLPDTVRVFVVPESAVVSAGIAADLESEIGKASPPIAGVLKFFRFAHLIERAAALAEVSSEFAELAVSTARRSSNAETTVALRKLLEAKDAAVRAVMS